MGKRRAKSSANAKHCALLGPQDESNATQPQAPAPQRLLRSMSLSALRGRERQVLKKKLALKKASRSKAEAACAGGGGVRPRDGPSECNNKTKYKTGRTTPKEVPRGPPHVRRCWLCTVALAHAGAPAALRYPRPHLWPHMGDELPSRAHDGGAEAAVGAERQVDSAHQHG